MSFSSEKEHHYAKGSGYISRFIGALFAVTLLSHLIPAHAQENSGPQKKSEKNGWELNAAKTSTSQETGSDLSTGTPEQRLETEVSNTQLLDSANTQPNISKKDVVKSEGEESQLSQYDISTGAGPIDVPIVGLSAATILPSEQRENIDRLLKEIQVLKETEDAFSETLGESYLAYGKALMQAGRVEESRTMFVNALHIAKINNGVNSIEQRPILRELFEMSFALGNTGDTDEQLRRIIWLEKQIPDNEDLYSFDMVVRLGNYYLDLFLSRPIVNEQTIDYLDKSTKFLGYAINRYGDRPLSEVLLPYGELALAHHLKSSTQSKFERSSFQYSQPRDFRSSSNGAGRNLNTNTFSRSQRTLKDYLRKSKDERDLVNTIRALLGLGDLSLLTDRTKTAKEYYDLAWTGAQNLPVSHPILESFNAPVKLPAFAMSVVQRPGLSKRNVELIPLSINIDEDGRVRKLAREALIETPSTTTNRAKRIAKRVRFRPVIEGGKLVSVTDYRYEVSVPIRKSRDVAENGSTQ